MRENDFPNLFSAFDFIVAWWRHRGYGNLFALIVKDDNKVVGIASLMVSEIKWFTFKARKVSFPIGNDIAGCPVALAAGGWIAVLVALDQTGGIGSIGGLGSAVEYVGLMFLQAR